MKRIIVVALALLACSGCAVLKDQAMQRVDLGDGMVFDVVPVGAAVTGANAVVPGSGEVLAKIEKRLAAQREAKLGPFNGLPYTRTRSVILKDGTVIAEAQIAKIVETLTPIVPAAVTRVIEPADFGTRPVGTTNSTTEATDPPSPGSSGAASSTDGVDELLEDIGGASGERP